MSRTVLGLGIRGELDQYGVALPDLTPGQGTRPDTKQVEDQVIPKGEVLGIKQRAVMENIKVDGAHTHLGWSGESSPKRSLFSCYPKKQPAIWPGEDGVHCSGNHRSRSFGAEKSLVWSTNRRKPGQLE